MDNTPCFECKNRHFGCHASCKDYSEWAEEQHKKREFLQKEANNAFSVIEIHIKAVKKSLKGAK